MKLFWTIKDKKDGDDEDCSRKRNFANAVKNFGKNDFEGFKPTLDLVLTVIKKWDEELGGATKAE